MESSTNFLETLKFALGYQVSVIVDDGGHRNYMILNAFWSLWPIVSPGGLYFIEDLGSPAYYWKLYEDAQHVKKPGDEKPGTVQFFLKELFRFLFCEVVFEEDIQLGRGGNWTGVGEDGLVSTGGGAGRHQACLNLASIELQRDHAMLRKVG